MRSMNGWASTPTDTGATARRDRPAGRRRIGRIAAVAVTAMLASTLAPGAMTPASADVGWAPPLGATGLPAFFDDGNVKVVPGPIVDAESFYFMADAAGGNLELFTAALESTGPGVGFSRMRIRVKGLLAGATYTVQHPYGVNTFVAAPLNQAGRSIDFSEDLGCLVACTNFDSMGAGFVGDFKANTTTFLKQVAPFSTATHLGDPLTAHPVTGAPSGVNAVIVTGPNAGGPGVNTLTVRDFTVQGQIAPADAAGTPSMPDLTSNTVTGIWKLNNITNANLPTFSGTLTGAATVNLRVDGALTGAKPTTGGTYTIPLTAKLTDGRHTVSAVSSTGVESAPLRFTVDTTTRLSDFNKDSRADMVARDKAGTLWLYPGNGIGGFLARKSMGAGWNTFNTFITPGDLNADGNGDVLARDKAGTMWLYPGNGIGGFKGRTSMGGGWNIFTAISAAGELNGDAFTDVLARDKAGTLWLYPGNGAGRFLGRTSMGAGWNTFNAFMGAGDLTGDTKADVLARDTAGTLWLYPGNGAGKFLGRTSMGAGWNGMTTLITPGNFDKVGGNDLIARDGAGMLWLYPGNNASHFGARRSLGAGYSGFTIG